MLYPACWITQRLGVEGYVRTISSELGFIFYVCTVQSIAQDMVSDMKGESNV